MLACNNIYIPAFRTMHSDADTGSLRKPDQRKTEGGAGAMAKCLNPCLACAENP